MNKNNKRHSIYAYERFEDYGDTIMLIFLGGLVAYGIIGLLILLFYHPGG